VRVRPDAVEYLVLGDVTIAIEASDGVQVITDNRVSATAKAERAEADRYPFGSAEKQAALLRMKHAELAARNQPGGYWVAAENPTVAIHAIYRVTIDEHIAGHLRTQADRLRGSSCISVLVKQIRWFVRDEAVSLDWFVALQLP